MRGSHLILIGSALVLAAAACEPREFGKAEAAEEEDDVVGADAREEARIQLIEADRAFARATADRGVDGWVEWFDPRGSMIQGAGEITGPAAVRVAMGPLLSDSTMALRWTPSRAEVSADASLGFTVGPYEVVDRDPSPGEEAIQSHGMYLTVWARQADASWKVLADIGNPAP